MPQTQIEKSEISLGKMSVCVCMWGLRWFHAESLVILSLALCVYCDIAVGSYLEQETNTSDAFAGKCVKKKEKGLSLALSIAHSTPLNELTCKCKVFLLRDIYVCVRVCVRVVCVCWWLGSSVWLLAVVVGLMTYTIGSWCITLGCTPKDPILEVRL